MSEKEPVCVGCDRTTVLLRECADGKYRCRVCRGLWLEKVWKTPSKPVPPSVGRQEALL